MKRPHNNGSGSRSAHIKYWLFAISLLLLLGITGGLFLNALHREQTGRDLILAIKGNDTASALVALKQGADPNMRDNSEEEPPSLSDRIQQLFDQIVHRGARQDHDPHPTALYLLEFGQDDNPTLTQALLDAGANPNVTGDRLQSPLMLAVMLRHSQSVRLLLNRGANIHQKDESGHTPLKSAIAGGSAEMVESMLDAGADIGSKDNNGFTSLHWACIFPRLETVQVLLRHHANVNARDNDGRTPLDRTSVPVIVQTLKQAGAKTGKELDAEKSTHRR